MKNDGLALLPQGDDDLLKDLKARVHKARMSAVLAANAETQRGGEPKSSKG